MAKVARILAEDCKLSVPVRCNKYVNFDIKSVFEDSSLVFDLDGTQRSIDLNASSMRAPTSPIYLCDRLAKL